MKARPVMSSKILHSMKWMIKRTILSFRAWKQLFKLRSKERNGVVMNSDVTCGKMGWWIILIFSLRKRRRPEEDGRALLDSKGKLILRPTIGPSTSTSFNVLDFIDENNAEVVKKVKAVVKPSKKKMGRNRCRWLQHWESQSWSVYEPLWSALWFQLIQ